MLADLRSENVVYKGIETRTSKKTQQPYNLVILADMDNVEKFEFFQRDELQVNGLQFNQPVKATFDISRRGFNTNIDLVGLETVKK